jgi:hypothetical protein
MIFSLVQVTSFGAQNVKKLCEEEKIVKTGAE